MSGAATKPLTFIDLFCGCGGFSLGLERAGFQCLAAIDFDKQAITTFKKNFSKETLVLRKDLTRFAPDKLAAKLGVNHVDVIVGGPPCQGYSTVRQVGAANHGPRVRKDKRRWLFRPFLAYVAAFRPRLFVMENVLGMQSAAKGKFFTMVQSEARKLGYLVTAQVEEAWKLGVPQRRRRQLIVGVRQEITGFFPSELKPARRAETEHPGRPSLWDAIGDLPALNAGTGTEEREYDLRLRLQHQRDRGEPCSHYLNEVIEIDEAARLTAHRARPHSERDLRDFGRLQEGENSGEAEARGVKMEFLYKRTCFKDRYKRQHRERLCSTIVAHLSKDGLMFIHPTQCRTLTPREAARVQTFPDWFEFSVARTHQFRLVGNAVPPLVAEAVGEEIRDFLRQKRVFARSHDDARHLPSSRVSAARELERIASLDARRLRSLSTEDFLRGWHALLFLFPGLHPDNALDHGNLKEDSDQLPLPSFEWLLKRRYVRSGWPVALESIGREAWRRRDRGELNDDVFYCAEAQAAGMNIQAGRRTAAREALPTLAPR